MEEMLHFDRDDLNVKLSIIEKSKEDPDLKTDFFKNFSEADIKSKNEEN